MFGLHKISIGFKSFYVVVMGNVFTPYKQIHEKYDLKVTPKKKSPKIEKLRDLKLTELQLQKKEEKLIQSSKITTLTEFYS
jgi:hypothetical protein